MVIICDFEGASNTHDTAITTSLDGRAELVDKLSIRVIHRRHISGGLALGTRTGASFRSSASSFTASYWVCCISATPSLFESTSAVKVPRVVHHEGKVLVIIDTSADLVVIFIEFFLCDDVVGSAILAHRVVHFESFQKFVQNLVLSLLAGKHVGVLRGRVNTSQVIDVDVTVSVFVELVESFGNNALAVG